MNSIISDIINSFETKSKKNTAKYKDFISHVYKTFDDKIKDSKVKKIKNKYKMMRSRILEYILINEKEITSKICKHK